MANINKNIIMQAGAAVANATNKAAGLSASTPEPGSIISAIQLVNGGRTIGPAALAHFTESVRNKLLSLLVTMEPIQDLHGYSSPWPAGGGKNKLNFDGIKTIGVRNGSATWGDNTVTMTATSNDCYLQYGAVSWSEDVRIPVSEGDVVRFTWTANNALGNAGIFSGGTSSDFALVQSDAGIASLTVKPGYSFVTIRVGIDLSGDSTTFSNLMVTVNNSDTTFSPYSNICPITGRTGANAYVSPTPNVADATTYTADWTTPAGTVYAGSADIVTGDIKAAPYYASYNGETLVGPWVSSMDAYDPDGTPTTGAQVVDLGGAMTEYHITGQDIITLVGDNYIWSDSGDVTITE